MTTVLAVLAAFFAACSASAQSIEWRIVERFNDTEITSADTGPTAGPNIVGDDTDSTLWLIVQARISGLTVGEISGLSGAAGEITIASGAGGGVFKVAGAGGSPAGSPTNVSPVGLYPPGTVDPGLGSFGVALYAPFRLVADLGPGGNGSIVGGNHFALRNIAIATGGAALAELNVSLDNTAWAVDTWVNVYAFQYDVTDYSPRTLTFQTNFQGSTFFNMVDGQGIPNAIVFGSETNASYAVDVSEVLTPVTFTSHPQDQIASYPQPINLMVTVNGTPPFTYQWRKDGVPMGDQLNRYQGTQTASLSILNWFPYDAGVYDCVVTNPVGQVTSDPAIVTIPGEGPGGAVMIPSVLTPPTPVPGLPGSNFTSFSSPVVAPTGEVVTNAGIDGHPSYTNLVLIGAVGPTVMHSFMGSVPGVSGALFGLNGTWTDIFDQFVVAEHARTTFVSFIYGPDITIDNRFGLWQTGLDGSHLIARDGNPAPGLPGLTYRFMSNWTYPRANAAGDVAFVAGLAGPGVTNGNRQALWRWSRGAPAVMIGRIGSPAPGTGTNFLGFDLSPVIGPNGSVVFSSVLPTVSGPNGNDLGLWVHQGGITQLIAKTGDPAPGFEASAFIDQPAFGWVVSPDDSVYFATAVVRPGLPLGFAIFRYDSNGLQLIVKRGDPTPGVPGAAFGSPIPVSTTASGDVLIHASLVQPPGCDSLTCPTSGVWLRHPGTGEMALVMTAGISEHASFLPVGASITSVNTMAVNSAQQVVIEAQIDGPGVHAGGVIGWTPTLGVFPIAVPGTILDIGEGDLRIAAGARLASAFGGVSGVLRSTSLTESGNTVLLLQFSGGPASGLYQVQFPALAVGWDPCTSFVVPYDVSVTRGEQFTLDVVGGDEGESTYQWRHEGTLLTDGSQPSGATVSGAETASLTVQGVFLADAGEYSIDIVSDCGEVTSSSSSVVVVCAADFDQNGLRAIPDIFAYLSAWFAHEAAADFDGVGGIAVPDIFAFLSAWFAGC